jgi:hypothetical protein
MQKLQNKPVVVIFAEESVSLYNVCTHTLTCPYRTLDINCLLRITVIVIKLVKIIRLFCIIIYIEVQYSQDSIVTYFLPMLVCVKMKHTWKYQFHISTGVSVVLNSFPQYLLPHAGRCHQIVYYYFTIPLFVIIFTSFNFR